MQFLNKLLILIFFLQQHFYEIYFFLYLYQLNYKLNLKFFLIFLFLLDFVKFYILLNLGKKILIKVLTELL